MHRPEPSPKSRVLLVPEDGLYLAFRLPPLLKRAGYTVDLLCHASHPLTGSRYIHQVTTVASPDDLTNQLSDAVTSPDSPWAKVIVTNETLVRYLVANFPPEKLSAWQPGLTDATTRAFALSKQGLLNAQDQWDLPIPRLRKLTSPEELVDLGNDWGWPLIAKGFSGAGGSATWRIDDAQGVADLEASAFPLLGQRLIKGRRGVVDMVCSRGEPLAWTTSWSSARYHVYGPSTGREFMAIPELTPIVHSIARQSRWEGFCGFDWIQDDQTGEFFFIEFHPRTPSGFRFGRAAGVDFAPAIRTWIEDSPLPDSPSTIPPGRHLKTFYFTTDLMRCLRQRDWCGLANWIPRPGHRYDIYWDDPPLMWKWLKHCVKRERGPF